MKRYLEHLLEDIGQAKLMAKQNMAAYFEKAEGDGCDVSGDDGTEEEGIRISDLMGVEIFMFPQLEYLTKTEVDELVHHLLDLWQVYGLQALFVDGVSNEVKYSMLRSYSAERVYPNQFDYVDVEMCDHLPQSCPFVKLCQSSNSDSLPCCNSSLTYKMSV